MKLFLELKDNLHVSFAGKTYNVISLNQEKSKQVWPDKEVCFKEGSYNCPLQLYPTSTLYSCPLKAVPCS